MQDVSGFRGQINTVQGRKWSHIHWLIDWLGENELENGQPNDSFFLIKRIVFPSPRLNVFLIGGNVSSELIRGGNVLSTTGLSQKHQWAERERDCLHTTLHISAFFLLAQRRVHTRIKLSFSFTFFSTLAIWLPLFLSFLSSVFED